jgi:hypothetical protein
MTNQIKFVALLAIASLFASTGCTDDVASGTLQLKLEETIGTEALTFDQMIYDAQAGHTYSAITLKYYLSRLQLKTKDGAVLDLADVIYRDVRDPETQAISFGEIPNGEYTSLEFVFGLDEVMNVDGGLENTIENINMEWPIPGDQGYHYMKFEGKYDVYNGGEIHAFNLHLGATGGNQNFFRVSLQLPPLAMNGNNWQIQLGMDLNEWIQNPRVYDFEEYGQAIMMNQTAQEHLRGNGLTVYSIMSVDKQ